MNRKNKIYTYTKNYDTFVGAVMTTVNVSANKKIYPKSRKKKFIAIWDTGATNTSISANVTSKCRLRPIGKATINTANGERLSNTYCVDIKLPNNAIVENVITTEIDGVEETDMLIGMDIITLGDFCISNFNDKTTFTFRMPSVEITDYTK